MEETQKSIISDLREKIEHLIRKYEAEKNRCNNLVAENLELKRSLEDQGNELNELQTKYETLRLAKSLGGDPEASHDAKIKINRIVREIDNCIAQLNK
ncbi:MAG: hypothetical protein ACOC0C_08985 [Bacteroidota bacterium]